MVLRIVSPVLVIIVFVSVIRADDRAGKPAGGNRLAVINFSDTEGLNEKDAPAEPSSAPNDVTTVTVTTLTTLRRDHAWLGKAIADLLIQDLSSVRSLVILERERMQAFSDEVSLGESALFDGEIARRVGRVARVDKVLFGNYELRGRRIEIEVSFLDLETQRVERRIRTSGRRSDLRRLIQELALRVVAAERAALDSGAPEAQEDRCGVAQDRE